MVLVQFMCYSLRRICTLILRFMNVLNNIISMPYQNNLISITLSCLNWLYSKQLVTWIIYKLLSVSRLHRVVWCSFVYFWRHNYKQNLAIIVRTRHIRLLYDKAMLATSLIKIIFTVTSKGQRWQRDMSLSTYKLFSKIFC